MAQKTLVQLSRGSSLSTVSIIGSAGRRGDAIKMTRELYWNMVDKAQCVISEHFKLDPGRVHLVSGGAAWADHVAITLFMQEKAAALTLHIPAAWESKSDGCGYVDNGKESQSNPGRVANKLHKVFGEKINMNTLQQVDRCKLQGAKLQVHDGFKKRNDSVALSDYLIAFSWSEGEEPTKKGGTKDTWNKAGTGKKLHIPLSSLKSYTRKVIQKETSVVLKSENSLELCDSQAVTHAEQPTGPQPSPTHTSHELPTSCAPTTNPKHNSQSSNSVESLDSGVGSLDSSQSSSKLPEKAQRKRKRSESTDIPDYSDLKHNDRVDNTTRISKTKKLKVSEFAKQALAS